MLCMCVCVNCFVFFRDNEYEITLFRELVQRWTILQPFYRSFVDKLRHSEHNMDLDCVDRLQKAQFNFEKVNVPSGIGSRILFLDS